MTLVATKVQCRVWAVRLNSTPGPGAEFDKSASKSKPNGRSQPTSFSANPESAQVRNPLIFKPAQTRASRVVSSTYVSISEGWNILAFSHGQRLLGSGRYVIISMPDQLK